MPKYLKSKEGSLESAVVEAVSAAKKDEGFASDAQRKAAFANGYKEPKNKKDKKEEMTAEDKEAYEKFFKSALKKFKVDSPADFKSDEEKKKFFDYVDKNYKGENEKSEQVKEEVSLAMKAAQYISSMWAEAAAEKDGVKAKTEEEEEPKKNGKTMTGKEMSKVEVAPKDKE